MLELSVAFLELSGAGSILIGGGGNGDVVGGGSEMLCG